MSVDMGNFIAPKSDQLNADDLIAGPRTITVTGVRANEAAAEQPVSIRFEGDGGKPYIPCKSMRRVMVALWGTNAATYVGRSMTLYCDPDVQFGGMKVGGIRISHMSHIEEPKSIPLTTTRARRALFTVKPLVVTNAAYPTVADYDACKDAEALKVLKARSRETWKQTPADEAPLIQAASKRATSRIAAHASDPEPKSTAAETASVQLDGTDAAAIAALEAAYKQGRDALQAEVDRIEGDYAARGQPIPLAVDAKIGELNDALKE